MIKYTFLVLATFLTISLAFVLNPEITYPTAESIWTAGSRQNITWDTEHVVGGPIPNDYTGIIKLGYLDPVDTPNEHLHWELAAGFPLNKGWQVVTLPTDLESRHTYIIVLMGNSGNASPEFTINAA
ncbi:hypothetical protein BC941DRAFT_418133, partial [Chlamydoabsidia padenii]